MRTLLVISLSLAILLFGSPAMAQTSGMQGDLAVGLGYNQGTNNEADESFCLSVKERLLKWEYGLDLCMSEDKGGVGDNNFAFVWGGWIDDFHRQDFQDYGIFAGVGAGVFVMQDELVDWPAGPFVIIGWDLSPQAGLEGKLGYFGENLWGTANIYWYFR